MQTVGVIGGGQLAWMMAEAAESLAIALIVQTPSADDPAVSIAQSVIYAPVADAIATRELALHCDVITFENEFIDLDGLQALTKQGVHFRPSLAALSPLLDKWDQRTYLQSIGLPVPAFQAWTTQTPPPERFPLVLKARRHGYDGQGTFIIRDRKTWEESIEELSTIPLLIEEFIPFNRELAVMAARGTTGEIQIYPIVETVQKDQVCRWTIAPADLSKEKITQIDQMARHLLESLRFVGIMGIELFETATGEILVNEIAPRTHNSGHYTLDACETSQFEMQLRAVTGLPLGSPQLTFSGAIMVNLLGYEQSEQDYPLQRARLANIPHAHLHWYGKRESRPGRKLGHITVLIKESHALKRDRILDCIQTIEEIWYPAPFRT